MFCLEDLSYVFNRSLLVNVFSIRIWGLVKRGACARTRARGERATGACHGSVPRERAGAYHGSVPRERAGACGSVPS